MAAASGYPGEPPNQNTWLEWTIVALAVVGILGTGLALAPIRDDAAQVIYNQGTTKLRRGELPAAESLLRRGLASDRKSIQQPALFNLAHTRFREGEAELRKGPDLAGMARRSQAVATETDRLLAEGDSLVRLEQDALVAAYLRGRGLRRDAKAASAAVREALKRGEAGLSYWGRAAGDFRSVVELAGGDTVAAYNASVVDRHIAWLIDRLQEANRWSQRLDGQRPELDRMLARLRGLVPKNAFQPGPGDDEEEEDEPGEGPRSDQEEARSITGAERAVSPEDAARLLESYQLDRGRELPMGARDTAGANRQNARDW